MLHEIQSKHMDSSRCWRHHSQQHLKGRGFASAIGTDESDSLAWLNLKGDLINGGEIAKAFGELSNLDNWRGHGLCAVLN
jgi:hypothetical protein